MDRLSYLSAPLLVLVALATGCGDSEGAAPAPAPGRVVAVQAAAPATESAETFCEVRPGADAPAFAWPEALEGDPPAAGSGWRWVNVWATWCRPCVEEMPRLSRFESRLEQAGLPVDVVFLGADTDAEAVARFHQEHPEHPTGPRVPDAAALRSWLAGYGLDEGAPLPIHLFVDPSGRVRCARTAAIGEDDYESVEALLRGDG